MAIRSRPGEYRPTLIARAQEPYRWRIVWRARPSRVWHIDNDHVVYFTDAFIPVGSLGWMPDDARHISNVFQLFLRRWAKGRPWSTDSRISLAARAAGPHSLALLRSLETPPPT